MRRSTSEYLPIKGRSLHLYDRFIKCHNTWADMSSVQVCVDVRQSPSGRFILSGFRAIFMFVTGVPGRTKWPVAPASATAMFLKIFNCAVV